MEIRPLQRSERDEVLDLLDGWELPDGWRGRAFFGRIFEGDPGFDDADVWVTVRSGRIVACAQIFPRRIRVLGHPVPTGGIGSVYTEPGSRGQGIASELLRHMLREMEGRGHELSLLFSSRGTLYRRLGWTAWKCERTLLRMSERGLSDREFAARRDEISADLELADFDKARDLAAVQAIHSAYSATRNGTVVRAEPDWETSLLLSGNPNEEFRVARQLGRVVAYLRGTILHSTFTATELARLEDGADGLAELIVASLSPRPDDPLARHGATSRQIRSSMLLPAFDDLMLTVGLEQRGVSSHPVEDTGAMLRCLNAKAFAQRLNVSLLPDEEPDAFLARILPHDSLVFWPADRW